MGGIMPMEYIAIRLGSLNIFGSMPMLAIILGSIAPMEAICFGSMPMLASILGSIPASILGSMPASILGSIPASILGSIPASILGSIPAISFGSGTPFESRPMLASILASRPMLASILGSMPATMSLDLDEGVAAEGKDLGSSCASIL